MKSEYMVSGVENIAAELDIIIFEECECSVTLKVKNGRVYKGIPNKVCTPSNDYGVTMRSGNIITMPVLIKDIVWIKIKREVYLPSAC